MGTLKEAWPQAEGIIKNFKWKTMEGQVLTMSEMETGHIFNSMKMIYNHIAEQYGCQLVWFTKKYPGYNEKARHDPKKLAMVVALFCYEIERRGDLPNKYFFPYWEIVNAILKTKKLRAAALQLPGE